MDDCIKLLHEIKKLEEFDLENRNIIDRIENNQPYKKILNSKEKQFREIKKSIKQQSKKIKIITRESKYKPFLESKRYIQFTGIDEKFFTNIL